MKPKANIQSVKSGRKTKANAVAFGGSLKASQAYIDQTQSPAKGTTFKKKPKNTRQDDRPSSDHCNHRINQALGKASGAEKVSNDQADLEPRRGKHHPAQAGGKGGNPQRVLVLQHNHQPAMPCTPARARQLLKAGKAAIIRYQPFVIILKKTKKIVTQPIRLKIDPGSKTTGIALLTPCKDGEKVVFALELRHRGQDIRDALLNRSQLRHGRRSRKTRYRQARFNNRSKSKGWLAPSIQHRVISTLNWVNRLRRFMPVSHLAVENARFDMQLMENPDVCGAEYQNGELAGWEIREYLLLKFDYKCAYCKQTAAYFEAEHLTPRIRGGSNRLPNLALSCKPCNEEKGTMTCEEFGHPEVRDMASKPLKDAAAVNSTRWALWNALKALGLPLETGTGGRTKKNRHNQELPKAHWIDAACIGVSGENVILNPNNRILQVAAQARNSRRMRQPDKYGFPKSQTRKSSVVHGFRTGDLVKAFVPKGKKTGHHFGRVAIRTRGNFRVGNTDGISFRNCTKVQSADGYSYQTINTNLASTPPTRSGVSGR